jgi:hypothetical protein
MSERVRLSLDLLYVALENLVLNVDDGDGHGAVALDGLLALVDDMKGSITQYWQALDLDVIDEAELGG